MSMTPSSRRRMLHPFWQHLKAESLGTTSLLEDAPDVVSTVNSVVEDLEDAGKPMGGSNVVGPNPSGARVLPGVAQACA